MRTNNSSKIDLTTIELFCPVRVSAFPQFTLDEFNVQLVDSGEVELFLDDHRTDDPSPYLKAFQNLLSGLSELPIETSMVSRLEPISECVDRIALNLEEHQGQIWLRTLCSVNRELEQDELALAKEYVAEQIVCNQDVLWQYSVIPCDEGVAAISFEPVDNTTTSCGGMESLENLLEGHHLLSKAELYEKMIMGQHEICQQEEKLQLDLNKTAPEQNLSMNMNYL